MENALNINCPFNNMNYIRIGCKDFHRFIYVDDFFHAHIKYGEGISNMIAINFNGS